MKHLKKTWRILSEEQTKVYHDMSELDRDRYDQQRRLLKQGLLPGQQCSCDDLAHQINQASELLLKENELIVGQANQHEQISGFKDTEMEESDPRQSSMDRKRDEKPCYKGQCVSTGEMN